MRQSRETLRTGRPPSFRWGALEALHFLKASGIGENTKILINGAGGSIGTVAVQMAKMDGAEVTAVDSAEKLQMLRECGADHVVDYAKEDFTKNEGAYDIVFDVVGEKPDSARMEDLEKKRTASFIKPKLFEDAACGADEHFQR